MWITSDGFFHGIDENGVKCQKTIREYPYSYDRFIEYRAGENNEANHCIYSDHLYKFSHGEDSWKHYNTICQKHFGNQGQYWYSYERPADKIEEFLRDYFDKPTLKLIYIMHGCNISSGYPIWEFHVHMGAENA